MAIRNAGLSAEIKVITLNKPSKELRFLVLRFNFEIKALRVVK